MKKTVLCTIFLCSLFLLSTKPISSQDVESQVEKAKQDYLFQYNKYLSNHEKYLASKNAFIQFGTVNARRDAIQDAKLVLIARAEAMRAYFQLLKLTLLNISGINQSLQEAQVRKIELTQSFLENLKENSSKTETITEINDESSRFQREAPAMTSLAWETLSVKVIGDAQSLEKETINNFNQLKNALSSQTDVNIRDNVDEIDNKLSTLRLSIDKMNASLEEYRTKPKAVALETHKIIKKEVDIFKTNLVDTISLLKELNRLK